jgi:ABC-type branched-subunit amino acid transport system substrate-binding protein
MSIITFSFTGTADRLKIKARVTGNDSRFIGTCECYLAPFPDHLLETIESEQQAFINWLSGNNSDIPSAPPIPVETNIPDLSQSSVPSLAFCQAPIEMQTNNPSFGQCRRLGEQKTRLFKQWMDTPPPSDNPNDPLLPNSASLRGELPEMLTLAEYRKNPNNHSFVIHTDTFDPDLNRRLQKLPFHTWGLMAAYDDAEVAFSTNEYTVSQASSDPPRVFVILGNDVDDNFESHRQAIERELLGFVAPEYWSCNAKNPISTPKSIQHPENNLYETLNQSIKEKRSPAILIFVGHTSSINIQGEASSQIWLNNQISISPATPAFKKILQELTKEGLIFAAFFSCNGLNIAHELMKQAEIPYILVSRDRLPIHIALISITQFLGRATEPGVSINMALHQVRQDLQREVETIPTKAGCPNASNLLVLFQNPIQPAYILRPEPGNSHPSVTPGVHPVSQNLWQKIDKFLRELFPNKYLRYGVLGIIGIGLAWMTAVAVNYFPPQYPLTACDDIRHANTNHEYLSCGERTLLKYPNLSSDQTKLYETAKEELKKASPDYSMVVKNLESLKDKPEISVAYYNAQAKKSLKEGIDSIKTIAVMLPLSDHIKTEEDYLPNSILTAVAQAQAQWNGDRNNRWNLEVILVNDFNDSENSSPVKFVTEQPKILGALSNYNSSLTKAFASFYKDKLTVVSATNTATDLTNIIPNYFRITTTTDVQAENIIKFLHDKGIRKVAIFSEKGKSKVSVFSNSFEQSIIKAGQNKGRIKILNSDLFELKKDMLSNIEADKIAKNDYEAIVINSNAFTDSKLPSKILDLISNISEKSPKCLIIGNEVVADNSLVNSIKNKGIKTDKLLISLPWSETSLSTPIGTNHDGKNFDARKLGDTLIRHRAFLTYDAIYVLLDAINQGAIDPLKKNDSQIKTELPSLIRGMTKKENNYFGVTGSITIDGSDRIESFNGLVQVKFDDKTKASKFVKAQVNPVTIN